MKAKLRNSAALVTLALIGSASADIIYSNLQNTAIPTGSWTGVTITVNGGSINPFFGGVGVANDPLLQPARTGTDPLDAILNLSAGTLISSSNGALNFSTGAGGSETHLGSTFTAGTEGYIGFNANGDYGWMRVIFTNDTGGALVEDWAYDSAGSGGSIVVGRVRESVVDATHNLVTLSPASSESFTLGSVLADKGGGVINSVSKTGNGTTILSGTNTYSGLTSVSGGVLEINTNNALGNAAAGTIVASGGTLRLSAGLNYPTAEALSLNGAGYDAGAGPLGALTTVGSGTTTYAGRVNIATDATIHVGAGTLNLTGGIEKHSTILTFSGGGTVNVTDNGIAGSTPNSDVVVNGINLIIGTADTYVGSTFIQNGGMIHANVANALPTIGGRSSIIMDATAGSSNLTLGASQSIASLSGATTSSVALGGNTLTVGASSGLTTFAGVISGNGGNLTLDTAGSTLVLSGANSYTGLTTISAGTLVVNGDQHLASGSVSVFGKLAGTGTLGGATTIQSGGTLAPGELGSVGTVHLSGDLSFASGSIFEWDINANSTTMGFDMVGAGGAVNVDTTNTIFRIVIGPGVDMNNSFWSTPWVTREWSMAAIFGSNFKGSFGSVETSGAPVNSLGIFTIGDGGLQYTETPEPTSAVAGLLLVAGLLRRQRS